MAKVKISEYSATPSSNTDIDNIDINEGCSPSGINNAIRALMSHLKNWQGGTSGDTLPVASGGTGSSTASAARTALGAANIPASGMAKSDGSTLSAGTAGTDYVAPATATTFTAKQTFTGSASTLSSKFVNALEGITVSATAATGTIAYYATTQSILYYTTNASANFTVNLTGNATTTLNTLMATGESITVVFLVTNGTTAYYNNVVQVDGTTVTPKWQNGTAPTAGNASSIDAYSYTIVKTANLTFTVFASQVQFK